MRKFCACLILQSVFVLIFYTQILGYLNKASYADSLISFQTQRNTCDDLVRQLSYFMSYQTLHFAEENLMQTTNCFMIEILYMNS